MNSKLTYLALAAAFALAATPALAATCTPTGPAPINKVGPKPAEPAGVPQHCFAPTANAANAPDCKNSAALAAYHKATDTWLNQIGAFVGQVKSWQGQADAYSTCIQNNFR